MKILYFPPPVRTWRSNDPKADAIRIGDGSVKVIPPRGNVTITIVIPTPFAATPAVRDEPFVNATCSGPNQISERHVHDKWDDDSDSWAHAADYCRPTWKWHSRARKQWARHAHRIPTKDLTVPAAIDDTAVDRIAAK